MENKKHPITFLFVGVCLAFCRASGGGEPTDFRPSAVPLATVDPYMSVWYFTSTAKVRGLRARPVIGEVFIPFLKDQDRWQQWTSMADNYQ